MKRSTTGILLFLLLGSLRPSQAGAQAGEALVGGLVGVAGGAVITSAIVVARAQIWGLYLDSPSDLIHWQTTPMIATPGAGVVFGFAGEDVLVGSIVGSTTGLLAGAGIGATLGWIFTNEKEWPWAGGVMGAGVGLTVGGLLGAYVAWRDERHDASRPAPVPDASIGLSFPL